MDPSQLGFLAIVVRTLIVHTVTYTAVGIAAMTVFRYTRRIRTDPLRQATLRDTDDPLVMAGPLFQPVRGALFGVVFYLLRGSVFAPGGWLVLWLVLVVVGILGTFAPAASSLEGLIYLKPSPTGFLWGGLVEILTQSLLLSVLTFVWVGAPASVALNAVFGVLFGLSLTMPALGLLARRAKRTPPT